MSKRNALLVAIAAVVVLAVFFLWPEPARADVAVSARIGGGFGGHHGTFRGGHHGGFRSGYHGGIKGGHSGGLRGGFRGGRTFGGHDAGHHGSFGHHRGDRKRGLLLGDRFRLKTVRHIDREHGRRSGHKGGHGGRHAGGHDPRFLGAVGHGGFHLNRGPLIGDLFRRHTIRHALHENRRDRHRGRHARGSDMHNGHGLGGHDFGGHDFNGRKLPVAAFHRRGWDGRRGRHAGRWLSPAPLVLSYDDPDVIVREIIIPVPIPAARPPEVAAEPGLALDPRGRVTLVGGEQGVVGDWARGDVLPKGVPLVTLDPAAYDLPRPPPGERYARVGNDVLRIDAGSRRIIEVFAR